LSQTTDKYLEIYESLSAYLESRSLAPCVFLA